MLQRPLLRSILPAYSFQMSSKVDSSLNSAGLTPKQSQALAERPMQQHEQPIIQAIKEMYSCKPTKVNGPIESTCISLLTYLTIWRKTTFDIYSKDAVFHDPVGIANGIDSVRSQFIGLAKIFSRADIPKFRILENPSTVPSNTILIDQDVAYYLKAQSSSPTKVMNSLLTLKLNDANKVVSHDEEWNHQKTTTSEDGFLGMINEQRKKFTAGLTDVFVGGGEKSKN